MDFTKPLRSSAGPRLPLHCAPSEVEDFQIRAWNENCGSFVVSTAVDHQLGFSRPIAANTPSSRHANVFAVCNSCALELVAVNLVIVSGSPLQGLPTQWDDTMRPSHTS